MFRILSVLVLSLSFSFADAAVDNCRSRGFLNGIGEYQCGTAKVKLNGWNISGVVAMNMSVADDKTSEFGFPTLSSSEETYTQSVQGVKTRALTCKIATGDIELDGVACKRTR